MSFRSCLYSIDYPEGHVFESEAEYDAALKTGWVEAPWLVFKKEDNLEKTNPEIETFVPQNSILEKVKNADKPDRNRPYKRRAAPAKRRKPVRNPD